MPERHPQNEHRKKQDRPIVRPHVGDWGYQFDPLFVTFLEGDEAGIRVLMFPTEAQISERLFSILPELEEIHGKEFAEELVQTVALACDLDGKKEGWAISSFVGFLRSHEESDSHLWKEHNYDMANSSLIIAFQESAERGNVMEAEYLVRLKKTKKIPRRRRVIFQILAHLISFANIEKRWPSQAELIAHLNEAGLAPSKSTVYGAIEAIGKPPWLPDGRCAK